MKTKWSAAGQKIMTIATARGYPKQSWLAEEIGLLPQSLNRKIVDDSFSLKEFARIAKAVRMTDKEIGQVIREVET